MPELKAAAPVETRIVTREQWGWVPWVVLSIVWGIAALDSVMGVRLMTTSTPWLQNSHTHCGWPSLRRPGNRWGCGISWKRCTRCWGRSRRTSSARCGWPALILHFANRLRTGDGAPEQAALAR